VIHYIRGTLRERFDAKYVVDQESGCWLWQGSCDGCGYGTIGITTAKNGRAHRIAWLLYRGEIPTGQNILHRCDVRCCVNPDHLFMGTQADNILDMIAKDRDRHLSGEENGRAKLTIAQVKEIKASIEPGTSLALRFNVTPGMIGHIRHGRSWKEI